jgi:hypothetical protein
VKEGEGEHGHECMAVKALPGSALEVVETEFFFHLLVSLLANPSRLDGSCQHRRLKKVRRGKKKQRTPASTKLASRASRHRRAHRSTATSALPALPKKDHRSAVGSDHYR